MELNKLSPWWKYQSQLKKLLSEPIQDIILFGSAVKGGSPNDLDLAILTENKSDLTEIKKKIKAILGNKADIQIINLQSIYSSLWLTLIKEGYSLKKGKFFSELYHIDPVVLYKYSIKSLNNVQKVQFERGIKNVLGKEGKFISRAVTLVPMHLNNRMIEFLKQWNIYYEAQEYELLPILRKEEI